MTADAYRLLQAPLGEPGSGRLRYSAAMTLFQAGRIGAEVLEVYRSCTSLDGQDARVLIAEYGLPDPREFGSAKMSIDLLLAEIESYLATLPGPGIAEVLAGMDAVRGGAIVAENPLPNPVISEHLDAALRAASASVPTLATAIRDATPHLNWISFDGYDPALIGPDFLHGHAFTSIIGKDAPMPAQDFDLGLFLVAPHVLYRDHKHGAPELYAPLTGPHGWRFGPNLPLTLKPAHQPIWNPPFTPHLTKVGPVPFLSIFAWTRDVDVPAYVVPAMDWAALEALRLGEDSA